MLNNYLKQYNRDGYVIIKNAINKKQCKLLMKKTIIPILHKKNIYLNKPKSWLDNNNQKVEGKLLYGKNGGHIISKKNKHFNFPALFNSKILNNLLDKIHSRNNKKKWKFADLAKEGLGWIHLRFPFYNYIDKNNDNVKCQYDSFHLDGTNNKINIKQSSVILPFITKVGKNEGGTAVIPGSHKHINEYILRNNYKTNKNLYSVINNIVDKNKNNVIDATGNVGDILLMHPHLIHSPSLADINSKIRVTFNLSTNIKK